MAGSVRRWLIIVHRTQVRETELMKQEYALKELDYSKMTEKDRKQILAEVLVYKSRHVSALT